MGRALALGADLHHAFMFARGAQHGLAFANIPADGFLAIHVRAGFHRRNGMQRVPMIGRTDQHDVQLVGRQHLAVVAVEGGPLFGLLPLANQIGRSRQHVLVHVAQGHDFDRRNLNEAAEVGLAIPAAADKGDPGLIAAGGIGAPADFQTAASDTRGRGAKCF